MNQRNIDSFLNKLYELLANMSGLVEESIKLSTDAWKYKNISKTKDIFSIEEIINRTHKEVDAECVKLLALHQPMAFDLRLIVAIIKINTDLERMVDLAVNIAQTTEYYLKTPSKIELLDLVQMANKVRFMVNESLGSFIKQDTELAIDVLKKDDFVDALKRKIVDEMLKRIRSDNTITEEGFHIILIAKNLERIADHATNIAEDVIFAVSGKDIRHTYFQQENTNE